MAEIFFFTKLSTTVLDRIESLQKHPETIEIWSYLSFVWHLAFLVLQKHSNLTMSYVGVHFNLVLQSQYWSLTVSDNKDMNNEILWLTCY